MTTAQVVYPDYEKFLSIDRFARPDHIVPPADTLGVIVGISGDITMARGLEMWLPLWVRLMGAFGTPVFNLKMVR